MSRCVQMRPACALLLLLACVASEEDPRASMSDDELAIHYRNHYPLIYAAGEADLGMCAG